MNTLPNISILYNRLSELYQIKADQAQAAQKPEAEAKLRKKAEKAKHVSVQFAETEAAPTNPQTTFEFLGRNVRQLQEIYNRDSDEYNSIIQTKRKIYQTNIDKRNEDADARDLFNRESAIINPINKLYFKYLLNLATEQKRNVATDPSPQEYCALANALLTTLSESFQHKYAALYPHDSSIVDAVLGMDAESMHIDDTHQSDHTNRDILLLGEADMSFTCALVKKHPKLADRIIVSVYEKQQNLEEGIYSDTIGANIKFLESKKIPIEYDVDATKINQNNRLKQLLGTQNLKGRFKRLYFNYPYVNTDPAIAPDGKTRKLLRDFFIQASEIQPVDGKIYMGLASGQHEYGYRLKQIQTYGIVSNVYNAGYSLYKKRTSLESRYKDYGYQHVQSHSSGTADSVDIIRDRQFIFKKQSDFLQLSKEKITYSLRNYGGNKDGTQISELNKGFTYPGETVPCRIENRLFRATPHYLESCSSIDEGPIKYIKGINKDIKLYRLLSTQFRSRYPNPKLELLLPLYTDSESEKSDEDIITRRT